MVWRGGGVVWRGTDLLRRARGQELSGLVDPLPERDLKQRRRSVDSGGQGRGRAVGRRVYGRHSVSETLRAGH